jgi:SAM-dependent methyltransferase
MPEEISTCAICNSTDHILFETLHTPAGPVQFRICRNCGLVFQSPRMNEAELQTFYRDGYRTLYQQTEEPTRKDLIMQEERAKGTLELVRDHIDKVENHLDIGSSSGSLLLEFQKAFGCASLGVEPGYSYRQFSLKRNLKVYAVLDEIPQVHPRFDLVSMMHVLEHLPNPIHMLTRLREEYMSTGGYLLLEVPNLIDHEALEFAHLFAFTPGTLRETVRQSGFNVIWTKTHGSFRSPVLKLYITLLAKVSYTPEKITPVRSKPWGIATHRKLGQIKRRLLTRFLPDWTWQSPEELWESDD